MSQSAANIDPADVARFTAIAGEWWDANGKFAPLHRLNPARLAFIRDQALARFSRPARARSPFAGLTLIDIGCGGGLLAEPMARLGFAVTAVDAGEENIAAARAHAEAGGLAIDYRCASIESLPAEAAGPFDVVLNMEVVEHTPDPAAFLRGAARLIAPGGLMIVATLNRTLKSLALAKLGAEYLLRWLPAGTHDWRRFIAPDQVRAILETEAVEIEGPFGLVFRPLSGRWTLSSDSDVNYMMIAKREAA
jgi:2-polyprenyl-6-hydroxyphenyl methylase/3-demethylubiquinone-9 3-methyltransferase